MHGGLTAAPDRLQRALDVRLDARLDRGSTRPVALGLSGGGDSRALLHLAADWARRAGRPLLALTVDHGLSPASPDWTQAAARMAAEEGAAWCGLSWRGARPAAGLPAAARAARHALLADAARDAGAAVLLVAHTADDVAETEWMRRGEAVSLGQLREWAPSPAWPQGRGLMLLRPLLETSRADLRVWLKAWALDWLEDPANADLRLARPRARAARPDLAEPAAERVGFGEALDDGRVRLARRRLGEPGAVHGLRVALACASGGATGVRGDRLAALLARLAGPGDVRATLGGAWVFARGREVEVGREPGRAPLLDIPIRPGAPAVWDGRFEVEAEAPGWSLGAAAGRMSQLSPADRAALARSPPAQRRTSPVFLRGEEVRLAGDGLRLRALTPARFDAAVGRVIHERDVATAWP